MSSDSELGELLQGFRVTYLKINAKKKAALSGSQMCMKAKQN